MCYYSDCVRAGDIRCVIILTVRAGEIRCVIIETVLGLVILGVLLY